MECLYLVLDWSSADMAGGDSEILVFATQNGLLQLCVMEQDS